MREYLSSLRGLDAAWLISGVLLMLAGAAGTVADSQRATFRLAGRELGVVVSIGLLAAQPTEQARRP